jgi:vancomycin resistance protein VanJ
MTVCPRAVRFLCLTALYALVLAALTLLNRTGIDRWWFGALNLYLPQMLWALPGVLLVLYALCKVRRLVWAPLLCIAWVLGPIMGFCWHYTSSPEPPESVTVRVMTCNVKQGRRDIYSLKQDIVRNSPDVVLFQNAEGVLNGPLGDFFREWNVRTHGRYLIASRHPLGEAEIRLAPYLGENHTCLRCRLMLGPETVTLYDIYFQSPREGLSAFILPGGLSSAVGKVERNMEARVSQARSIGELVKKEEGPVIVTGDLNSADSSRACKALRGAGLHDAFAEGGTGYGYSYGHYFLTFLPERLRFSWLRIDHIMMNSGLRTNSSWTGSGAGSDHRPVFADLVFRRP